MRITAKEPMKRKSAREWLKRYEVSGLTADATYIRDLIEENDELEAENARLREAAIRMREIMSLHWHKMAGDNKTRARVIHQILEFADKVLQGDTEDCQHSDAYATGQHECGVCGKALF